MIVEWAPAAYIVTLLVVVWCLYRGHRAGKIDLWDTVRAGRDGKVFTDPTKLFLAGAFVVMTVGFSYLTLIDKMSEFYAGLYLATFAGAKWARDREQRLNRQLDAGKPAETK